LLAAGLAAVSSVKDECSAIADSSKYDCGVLGTTEDQCTASGCCWAESDTAGVPWCFFKDAPASCFVTTNTSTAAFSDDEIDTMASLFLANINIEGSGGVVAAPDYDTPGGSYYFHWERDGALTMRCLQETGVAADDTQSYMEAYVKWVLKVQADEDPHDQDVRTEPKYMLPGGEVYDGSWCRPQNDGPGLRGTALMIFANTLLASGDSDYVAANLWTADGSLNGGAIKYDLDYVVSGWESNSCDLWEEIQSSDFFWNRITMKKAMLLGADFAKTMGDDATAATYAATAASIDATLYDSHFNGDYVLETTAREKDGAVIVGFNDGFHAADGLFAPTSLEVAKTVAAYNLAFSTEYAINTADTANGLPGILYGRYPGDTYAGGNPWVLTTAALATLFYRGSLDLAAGNLPDADAQAVWADALGEEFPASASAASDLFLRAGDSVMIRLRSHVVADDFHLDEQIDRNTGVQMSAKDLTWSYAEVLNAVTARKAVIDAAATVA